MKKPLHHLILIYLFASTFGALANAPGPLSLSLYPHDAACNSSTGFIDSYVSGGTPPYTYLWSTVATTSMIQNIPPGTYSLTVHDALGDSVVQSSLVSAANIDLTAGYSFFGHFPCDPLCNGDVYMVDGYIRGVPPYTFTCSSGTIVPNTPFPGYTAITGLCATLGFPGPWHDIYVTDAAGCTGYIQIGIETPPEQTPSFSITPACNSLPNGSIAVSNLQNSPFEPEVRIVDSVYNTVYVIPPSSFYDFTTSLPAGNYVMQINHIASWWVNGPCSQFFPFTIPDLGPNCSTVQGDVYVDINANCVKDAGDIPLPNTVIEFTPGPWYAYSNDAGYYTTNLAWGSYNMIQHAPVSVTQICPSNPYPIILSSSNTSDTVNFADTSNIPFDVTAHISRGTARPGFNFSYSAGVKNYSYTASGMLTVTLDYDPILTFVSSATAPFSTSPGQIVWHLPSITNFQTAGATATFSVPPNPALIGDTLTATVTVSAATAEPNLTNNTTSTSHIITGSFDPNVKTVEQPAASFVPATEGLFNYTIQFQNTGNDTAFNIEVVDTLNSNLDVTTFVPGASSHEYTTDLTGQGVIHFQFSNINLVDSTTDEAHSHGFVSFQIRSKANLTHGTVISNKSDIIFDFNPPVATNTTQNTVDLSLAIQASSTTICEGQSTTLTMIPELQNTAWRWRTGNCSGTLAGSGNSIIVSPISTTTYYVRDSAGTIPTGSCYRKTIVVYPLPTANITPGGPTTFCQDDSVTLTSSSASSYLWSDNSTSQSITVYSSGNFTVTVTDANNCSMTSSLVAVNVNPLPNASISPSGPTTFCQGDSVTLTSSSAAGNLWSDNSISQSITVYSSGNYFVTVTDANNCSAASSTTIVTANPNPPVPNITQSADSLISDPASTYQWYFGGVIIPGATSQSYHPSVTGNYSVVIIDANNCSATSADYPFILTGMENISGKGIAIYVDPVTRQLEINCLHPEVSGAIRDVEIYDLPGRKVYDASQAAGNYHLKIDISKLGFGIYFVRVFTGNGSITKKLITN